jgi:hypothetical protein
MQNTQLAFHRLSYVPERDGVMVGRPEIESYVVLPEDGAQLLRQLADGMSVATAAGWYESTFGEPIDIGDFIDTLTGLGFVRDPGERESESAPVRLQALGRAMFAPAAWSLYAVLVAATVFVAVRVPGLRPAPRNVFFVPYLVVVQLVLMVSQTPGLFLHEWFHVMAGRRRGLPARLGVGRRLFFVVFETELNGLLSLPRRQRYLPFAAGMVADVVLFCTLTLAAAGLRDGPEWLWRLLLAIAYLTLLRLAWQMCLFLRTDPYYMLTTALGCVNLAEAASAYLRRKIIWKRAAGPDPDADAWSPRDKAMAPWFALLNVGGSVVLVTILLVGAIPVAVEFASRMATALAHQAISGPRFWDAAVSLAVITLEFCVFPLLAGSRFLRRHGRQTSQEISS